MPELSLVYQFKKPKYTETADIAVLNENMDKVDDELNKRETVTNVAQKTNTAESNAKTYAKNYTDAHIANTAMHVTQTDKDNWNSKATQADIEATRNMIPTKLGQLENDSHYIKTIATAYTGNGATTRHIDIGKTIKWVMVFCCNPILNQGYPSSFAAVPGTAAYANPNVSGGAVSKALEISADGKGFDIFNPLPGGYSYYYTNFSGVPYIYIAAYED